MDLDQHCHPQLRCRLFQIPHGGIVECGHNKQNAVGTHHPRFVHLIRIDQKVLAQDRQTAGSTRLHQMLADRP